MVHKKSNSFSSLSMRQLEILGLISTGLTNEEIGNVLFLKEQSVKNYISQMHKALGTRNKVEIVALLKQQESSESRKI